MLIGYRSAKLQKICEQQKAARKHLGDVAPEVLFRRIAQLAAYDALGQVPFQTPPLHYHPLRANLKGKHAVTVQGLLRVIFRPTGDYTKLDDGTPDLSTVTEIEIVAVEDYHE